MARKIQRDKMFNKKDDDRKKKKEEHDRLELDIKDLNKEIEKLDIQLD